MTRRPLCLLCMVFMAGMVLLDLLGFPLVRGNPLPEHVAEWLQETPSVSILGEVISCAETDSGKSVILKNTFLAADSIQYPISNIILYTRDPSDFKVGALIFASGKLTEIKGPENPGEFDRRHYLACRHIFYTMQDASIHSVSKDYSVPGNALAAIAATAKMILAYEMQGGLKIFHEEDAALFCALLLGDKGEITSRTRMRYQLAGFLHILSISGLHVGILCMGFYKILMRCGLGIWPSGILSLFAALFYGALTGGSVSTFRAFFMFMTLMGAKITGRIYDPLSALSLAAIWILTESPAYLYDTGFLMSFGAAIGAGVLAPFLWRLLDVENRMQPFFLYYRIRDKKKKAFLGILQGLEGSIAVQILILPIQLWSGGEVPVWGVLLNLLILPAVSIVILSGLSCLLLGTAGYLLGSGGDLLKSGAFSVTGWPGNDGLFFAAGRVASWPGRMILRFYDVLSGTVGKLPSAAWTPGAPAVWQIVLYYGIILLLFTAGYIAEEIDEERITVPGARKRSRRPPGCVRRWLPTAAPLMILAFGILAWRPGGTFRITCLSVGQGDCIVVKTPEGRAFLIDGGSTSKEKIGQYQILPFLKNQGISYLDGIFISHADTDHINGIQEMLSFMSEGLISIRAGVLLLPDWKACVQGQDKIAELASLAEKAGLECIYVRAGDCFKSGSVTFRLLAPLPGADGTDANEDSEVMLVSCGHFEALFTGDIGEETEKKLLPDMVDVDFLKTAHHGSRFSTCREFLEVVSPEIAVISCSAKNKYGHPSPETIRRLQSVGCRVEYTMKNGAITVEATEDGWTAGRFLEDS